MIRKRELYGLLPTVSGPAVRGERRRVPKKHKPSLDKCMG